MIVLAAGVSARLTVPVAMALTVSTIVAICSVTPVARARIVTVEAPAAAVPDTASSRLLVVDPDATVAGVKVAETPVGSPSAVSAISPAKLMRLIVSVAVPVAP